MTVDVQYATFSTVMKSEQIKPRLIAFEVTRRCRFNCRHCRAGAGCGEEEKELTTSQCKRILGSVAKLSKCVIILTGGEPMERSDIYRIIQHGRKAGLRMVMATCGYMIDESAILKLKEAGIKTLSFSLDGASSDTHDAFRGAKGAFDSAIRAAETARAAGMQFQINTTISKINIGEIIAIADLAKRLGAYCFNPFILVPTGRGRELADAVLDPIEYEGLLNELLRMKLESKIEVRVTCGPEFSRVCQQARAKKLIVNSNGCMGGVGFGFISWQGDVQICGFLDVPAGNLIESKFNFGKIWLKSELLNEIRNRVLYKGDCGVCEYVGLCGGCRARAFASSGDYLAADPVCNYQPRGKS